MPILEPPPFPVFNNDDESEAEESQDADIIEISRYLKRSK